MLMFHFPVKPIYIDGMDTSIANTRPDGSFKVVFLSSPAKRSFFTDIKEVSDGRSKTESTRRPS